MFITQMYVVVLVVSVYLIQWSSAYTYNDSTSLVRHLLTNYDSRQIPVEDQTHPIRVSMQFYLVTIQDFDEVAEKFSVYGAIWMTWTDEILTWNPADHGGAFSAVFKLTDVWHPKLVINNPHSKLNDLGDDWMIVRIYSTGSTSFTPGSVFESTCSVDVTYYPFDTQHCFLSFSVWGYSAKDVVLTAIDQVVNTDSFIENGEWSLVSTDVQRVPGSLYLSDVIHFNFIIKRKPTFLIVNVLLPIIFISIINLLVFVLPPDSGERVSYSVTVLLTLAVFMTLVGDNLPKTSEPMSVLSYYLISLLILSTMMTVTTIINLKLYFLQGQAPNWLACTIRTMRCLPCRSTRKKVMVTPTRDKDMIFVLPETCVEGTDSEEGDIAITWQDVSLFIDKVAIVTFFASTIIVNTIFLVNIAQNKNGNT